MAISEVHVALGCLSGQLDDQPVSRADADSPMGVASEEENKEKVLERMDLNVNSQPHRPPAGLLVHDYTPFHLANGAPHSNPLSPGE